MRKVDQKMLDRAKVLRNAGLTQADVADMLGVGAATVSKMVNSDYDLDTYMGVDSPVVFDVSSGYELVGFAELSEKLDKILELLEQSKVSVKRTRRTSEYNKFVSRVMRDNPNMTIAEAARLWKDR